MQAPGIFLLVFVLVAVAGVVVGIVYAGKGIVNAFDSLEHRLASAVDQSAAELALLATDLSTGFQTIWAAIEYAADQIAEHLGTYVAIAIKAMEDSIGKYYRAAAGWLQSALHATAEAVATGARLLADEVKTWLQAMTNSIALFAKFMLRETVKMVRPVTSALCDFLHEVIQTIYDLFTNPSKFFTDKLLPLIEEALQQVYTWLKDLWKDITSAFDSVEDFFSNLITEITAPIKSFIDDVASVFVSGTCDFFRELDYASKQFESIPIIGFTIFPCNAVYDALFPNTTAQQYCSRNYMCHEHNATLSIISNWKTTSGDVNFPLDSTPHAFNPADISWDNHHSTGLHSYFTLFPDASATLRLTVDWISVSGTYPIARRQVTFGTPNTADASGPMYGGFLPVLPWTDNTVGTDTLRVSLSSMTGPPITASGRMYINPGGMTASMHINASPTNIGAYSPGVSPITYHNIGYGDHFTLQWTVGAETSYHLIATDLGDGTAYVDLDTTPNNQHLQQLHTFAATAGPTQSIQVDIGPSDTPDVTTGFTFIKGHNYSIALQPYTGAAPTLANMIFVSPVLKIINYINILSPSSGDNVIIPNTDGIEINSSFGPSDTADVYLYQGNTLMQTLYSGTTIPFGTSTLAWPVLNDTIVDGNYTIKIFLPVQNLYDAVDITIQHAIAITSPSLLGSPYYLGYNMAISWSDAYNPSSIDINLIDVTAVTTTSIVTGLSANNGVNTFQWTIPVATDTSHQYQIQIVDSANSASATSPTVDILMPLTITTPTMNNFYPNAYLPVLWSYAQAATSAPLKITLQSQTHLTSAYTLTSTARNDGAFYWYTPPNVIPDDYLVIVQDVSRGISVTSTPVIHVPGANPMVFSSTPATTVYLGQDMKLNWTYSSGSNAVQFTVDMRSSPDLSDLVNLLPNPNPFGGTITNDPINGNSLTYTIPVDWPVGNGYQFVIHANDSTWLELRDLVTPVTTIANPIVITSPVQSAKWQRNSDNTVTYTYANPPIGSNITWDLYNTSNTYPLTYTPDPQIANQGLLTIPNTVVVPANYQIRATETLTGVVAYSASFSVVLPITVTAPALNDMIYRGDNATITWTYTIGTPNMKVEMFNAQNTYVLSASIVNVNPTTSISVLIPLNVALGTYQIRVTDIGLQLSSVSDTFTISSPITITAPASGLTQQRGSNLTVTWTYAGGNNTSHMMVELYNNLNSYTLIPSVVNAGLTTTHVVAIPNTVLVPASYYVRVTDIDVNGYYNVSPSMIITYPLTVTAPLTSSSHARGATTNVSWNYSGTESVKVELVETNSNQAYTVVASTINTPSSKTVSIVIPTYIPTSTAYVARVSSLTYAISSETGLFTIHS